MLSEAGIGLAGAGAPPARERVVLDDMVRWKVEGRLERLEDLERWEE